MHGFWLSGLILGMIHALDPDHIAAIGPLSSADQDSNGQTIVKGLSWGLGHFTTLFIMCALMMAFKTSVGVDVETSLELVVAIMLILLGCRVLLKMGLSRSKPVPRAGGSDHAHKPLENIGPFSWPSYGVGLVHGMAGSAALFLIITAVSDSIYFALINVIIFGLGAALGMALLCWVLNRPIAWVNGNISGGKYWSQTLIAAFAILVGVRIIVLSSGLSGL